ncbi:MAG: DUF721 domain-containing protein [Armatimonadota bacterium]|nr:DUF721 domain-containing protein [Armatimonadota bacterium]MDR5702014.1 DUF721 domain-containing protein [Armatimonadota bacterium]MDR7434688.1 DUF721 domain-containing protein [Armatimonadota bacterium]
MGRRRRSELTPIQEVLRRSGPGQEWARIAAAALAQHLWEEVVGQEVARVAWARSVQNGVLIVVTSHPVWAQELSLRRKELIEEIHRRVGAKVLEDIRFVVASREGE